MLQADGISFCPSEARKLMRVELGAHDIDMSFGSNDVLLIFRVVSIASFFSFAL